MDKKKAERIQEVADEEGLDVAIREYSGRFMYGKSTWAATGPLDDVADAVAGAGLRMSEFRKDSMALNIIIY